MNPISDNLVKGTLGELLVQARLLCYGVQAAPPLKDSGNDLIAVKGPVMRAMQVKATRNFRYVAPSKKSAYHILAVVQLIGEGQFVDFQSSKIYLIPRPLVHQLPREFSKIQDWEISPRVVELLFQQPQCPHPQCPKQIVG